MNSGRTRINILGRLLVSAALFASSALAQTLTTPNRTLPHFDPPRTSLEFSESPTDEEISRARAFEEPLVPIGGKPTAQENSDLAAALLGYAKRSGPDDFASLTGFLDAHPNSPWAAALLTDLGLEYYNTAHYSLALDVWTKAWSLARQARDAQGRALADRAVAELAQMDARLGRMTELDALLKSVASRTLIGSANQKIDDARDGLWTMQNRPEVAFRCGPLALRRIKLSVDPKNPGTEEIYKSASTQHGFSLPQVAELSTKIGLNYQMAFRGPDGAFVVPSVIHWKLGHYAAIVRKVGDRYLVQDPTFRNDVWATEGALDAEASGYFLIPPGSLPGGWRTVDVSEGASVWGKGMTIGNDPGPICPMDPQTNPQACQEGMMVSTVHYMDVNLSLKDQPLGYTPPVGPPVKFTIRYNSRDAFQPANFTYANFGPLWTCDWIAYINDNPQSPLADVNYYAQGGGDRTFTGFEPTTQAFGYQQYDETLLTRTGTNSYQMLWPDGSKLIFAQPDGSVGSSRKVFLTQIVDPQGNAITLTYDSMLRLMAITDAIGQVTTLSYAITNQITNPGNYITNDSSASDYYPDLGDFYKITQVTDPFGRTAMFNYINPTLMQTRTIIYTYKPTGNDPPMTTNIVDNYHYWRLGSVTDVIGITSEVGEHIQLLPVSNSGSDTYYTNGHIATATLITNYVASESVVSLETPYGETDFDSGSTNTTRFLETTYPDGSRDRVEYNQTIPIPMNDPVASIPAGMNTQNDYEGYRNTFYWSRNACASSYGDYTKAKIYHWLHTFDLASTAGILESTKEALENRVWYDYAGQNSAYTSLVVGNNNQPTQVGRVLDDGSTQLHTYAYNGFGRLTNSVDPVGRTFSYLYNTNGIDLLEVFQTRAGNNDLLFKATYNSQHLPLTVTDAAGQTSTATYNSRGQITSVTDARNEATAFGYDTNGYLITIAGPLPGTNDTDTITYDGYGRPRSLTDTSGYTEIYDYDNLDRLTRITHPDGSFEQYTYDRMDLVTVQDRAGRQTSLSYDNMRQITRKTDPLGRVTLFEWCQCGTLKSMTDPLGHTTSWVTDVEDRKTAKQYSDGSQDRRETAGDRFCLLS